MIVPEAAVPLFLRATHANAPFVTEAGAHRAVRRQALRPEPFGPPKHLRPDVRVDVHRQGGSPVYTVTPSRQPPLRDVVYVHGGGWVHEIAPQHWALIAQLAAEARATVTVPIYRLLPDGNARQAHDLVLDVARRVIDRRGRVQLAGDSAGGQIALSVAQTLRDQGVPSLRTVLVSPALDLGFSNPRILQVQPSDPWLGRDGGRVLGRLWADGLSIDDPVVSPLAGSFHGLGPMLVHTGTHDVLNPDAHLLVEAARAAGVDVTLRERPGALHVFPLLPTRSGRAARQEIVRAVRGA